MSPKNERGRYAELETESIRFLSPSAARVFPLPSNRLSLYFPSPSPPFASLLFSALSPLFSLPPFCYDYGLKKYFNLAPYVSVIQDAATTCKILGNLDYSHSFARMAL
jgi:hypothetical protein